jgi:hypothetical protein
VEAVLQDVDQAHQSITNAGAAQIAGSDTDYYLRDLFDAIERRDFPKWTVSVQVAPPGIIQRGFCQLGFSSRVDKDNTHTSDVQRQPRQPPPHQQQLAGWSASLHRPR